eukprot:SAG31_NODE_132_length_23398_cov_14.557620_16_plen_193_part_00
MILRPIALLTIPCGFLDQVVTSACEAAGELAAGLGQAGLFDEGWACGILPCLFALASQSRATVTLAADAARFRIACHCHHPAVLGVAARVAHGYRGKTAVRSTGAKLNQNQEHTKTGRLPVDVASRVAALDFLTLSLQVQRFGIYNPLANASTMCDSGCWHAGMAVGAMSPSTALAAQASHCMPCGQCATGS